MTNITFDLRQGGGALPLIGGVEFRPTRTVHAAANVVMPAPQTIGLHDGKGTMTGVTPTPAGSSPSWAYMATVVEGATNREWSWLVVVPDVPSIAFEALSRPVQVNDPVIDVGALAEAVDGATKKVAVHPVTGDVTVTRMDGATYLAGNSKGPAGPPGPGIPDGGAAGQVPARTADGGTAWASAASLVPAATTSTAGLLSSADKTKLDAAPTTASVTAAQTSAVTTAKTYTDGLVGNQVSTMATKDTLIIAASLPGAVSAGALNVRPNTNSNFTIFTAPFPLKIVSVTLVQSVATIPVDTTNFMAVRWRKVATNGTTFSTVADKFSSVTAWEVHKPWSFDNESQTEANKTMAAGEGLNLSFSVAGTGYYLFPIYATVRYLPL